MRCEHATEGVGEGEDEIMVRVIELGVDERGTDEMEETVVIVEAEEVKVWEETRVIEAEDVECVEDIVVGAPPLARHNCIRPTLGSWSLVRSS